MKNAIIATILDTGGTSSIAETIISANKEEHIVVFDRFKKNFDNIFFLISSLSISSSLYKQSFNQFLIFKTKRNFLKQKFSFHFIPQ